ncbi:hypothetical protein IW261DRAFT_1427273 [Armillaria novae-zelandiae]|uniref:Uncharacterized protein n=1 Tax=Armillaria novae-zelandiae TaxID=153914 RepID=A0AA39NFU1_9AGAR|nr:hypothetical protein IW261DRAFT_1427273 [Armillaria novae-zelandiae]
MVESGLLKSMWSIAFTLRFPRKFQGGLLSVKTLERDKGLEVIIKGGNSRDTRGIIDAINLRFRSDTDLKALQAIRERRNSHKPVTKVFSSAQIAVYGQIPGMHSVTCFAPMTMLAVQDREIKGQDGDAASQNRIGTAECLRMERHAGLALLEVEGKDTKSMMTHQGHPTRFGSARSYRFRPVASFLLQPLSSNRRGHHSTYQAPFLLEFPGNSGSTEISSDFVAGSDVSAPGIPFLRF